MNNNFKNIFKNLYDDILIPYENTYNSPLIISGGCIRDTLLEKPIKDIDIYIPFETFSYATEFFGTPNIQMGCYYTHNNDRKTIYEHTMLASTTYINFKHYNINLMCMAFGFTLTKQNLNNLHAIGLSQCTLDINGLEVSEMFIKDVEDQQMTLTRLDWGLDQSLRYFMKLYKKYEYPLRIKKD